MLIKNFFILNLFFYASHINAENHLKKSNWSSKTRLGIQLNSIFTQDWIGVTNGENFNFGAEFDFSSTYKKNNQSWANHISIREGISKTPLLPVFLKTHDELAINSKYKHGFPEIPSIGPFVKFTLQTSLFPGKLTLPNATPVSIDGGANSDPVTEVTLTTPFGLTSVIESTGFFWQDLSNPNFRIKLLTVLLSFSQHLYKNQKKVVDTSSIINLKTLFNLYEIGSGLEFNLKGDFFKKKISYNFGLSAISPWWQNRKKNESFFESLTVILSFETKVKIHKGINISWNLQSKKVPQISGKYQLQSVLLLNFIYKSSV